MEEYIIGPDNVITDTQDYPVDKDQVKLYGAEEGKSWIAKPVTGQSTLNIVSRHGSMANQNVPLMDPMVTFFGSVHEKLPEMGSMLFSNFGSMLNAKPDEWDEENVNKDLDHASEDSGGESDDNLRSPLISRQETNAPENAAGEHLGGGGLGIGGGWQLAYRKDERSGTGGLKRIFLHQEGGGPAASRRGSVLSLSAGGATGESFHAAALVSQSVLHLDRITDHSSICEVLDKQPEAAAATTKGRQVSWRDLCEPGVKHALIVGVGIQILQQVNKLII